MVLCVSEKLYTKNHTEYEVSDEQKKNFIYYFSPYDYRHVIGGCKQNGHIKKRQG